MQILAISVALVLSPIILISCFEDWRDSKDQSKVALKIKEKTRDMELKIEIERKNKEIKERNNINLKEYVELLKNASNI